MYSEISTFLMLIKDSDRVMTLVYIINYFSFFVILNDSDKIWNSQ